MTTFTNEMRDAAKMMRERNPGSMGGIFECARADGKTDSEAWDIVDVHYANITNQDYRAAAGYQPVKAKDKAFVEMTAAHVMDKVAKLRGDE